MNEPSQKTEKLMRCEQHGKVLAQLKPKDYTLKLDDEDANLYELGSIREILVPNLLVYVCPECQLTLGIPHQSTNQIRLSIEKNSSLTYNQVRLKLGLPQVLSESLDG